MAKRIFCNQRKATSLLPMLYAPRELEEELGIPASTIREWTKQGLPHERDTRGCFWINGVELAQWLDQIRASTLRMPLKADEAFCLHCKQAVALRDPQVIRRGKRVLLQGQCPVCGSTINRGGRDDPSQ